MSHHLRLALTCLSVAVLTPVATAQLGLQLTNGGTDTYLECQYDKTLVPQTGLTVEAWVTYDGSTLGTGWRWPTILRQNLAANGESFVFRVDAGQTQTPFIKLAVRTPLGFQTVGYTFTPGALKTWTHVAGTFDGQTIRFFVNGVQQSFYSFSGVTTLTDTGGALRIGCGDDLAAPGIETWNGELDEVRLWPYARTAAEILSTMNVQLSSVPGEVSCWNLNFDGKDSSGSNDCTPVNNPTFAVNTNALTAPTWTSTLFGAATAGCAGSPAIGASGTANVGNAAYALTCVHAARSAGGIGFAVIGVGKLAASIPVGAAALWVDPTAVLITPVPLDTLGFVRLPVPIPNNPLAVGVSIYTQMAFAQSGCATAPYASAGLQTMVTR